MSDEENAPAADLGELQAQLAALKESNDKLELKNRELVIEKQTSNAKAEEAEAARIAAAEKAARESGNTESLDKSWSEKWDARESEVSAKIESLTGDIKRMTSGTAALSMASEIADQGSAEGLLPHIERRLDTEYRDGKPVTVVLDKEGRPSAMTVDELKEELKNTPYLAGMIAAPNSSGAGGSGGKGSGGAGSNKTLDKMNSAEKLEHYRKIREG